jgi:CRISPR system Cascade subunit CasA
LEAKFNLLDEQWIKVRKGTNVEDVSLKDVFRRAHEYDALSGELPTQDAAILRLLLAVLYAIFMRWDTKSNFSEIKTHDEAIARWRSLRELGRFPAEVTSGYLDEYRDRFWLFHPQKPFFQVAGIRTSDDKENPIAQIIAHVPSRTERRFFTELGGEVLQSLTFEEAARWLVHLQAWDYAGKKASVEGGRPNGGGTGWCGKLGVVYPVGGNLFETLMFNLAFADSVGQPITFGSPVWEAEPKTAAGVDAVPQSYIELLTWQSRRVRLFGDEHKVTGVLSSYGDVFAKENTFIEQMSGWHESSQKGQGYIPNTHNASRSMWRDLGAILPQVSADGKSQRPGVLDWLVLLEINENINICAVGYEYGAMMGVVNEMLCDSLTLNAKLLSELGKEWVPDIIKLVEYTEKAVNALGTLAADLDKAAGGDGVKSRESPKERAYFLLDEPFREWLRAIDPDSSDRFEISEKWKNAAKQIILKVGNELIAAAGPAAFIGRELTMNRKTYYMTSAVAETKFRGALRNIFGGGEKNEQ